MNLGRHWSRWSAHFVRVGFAVHGRREYPGQKDTIVVIFPLLLLHSHLAFPISIIVHPAALLTRAGEEPAGLWIIPVSGRAISRNLAFSVSLSHNVPLPLLPVSLALVSLPALIFSVSEKPRRMHSGRGHLILSSRRR